MQSKSANFVGRNRMVYQWLSVKHIIHPNYHNLLLLSFFEFRNLLDSAIKTSMSKNLKTFNDKNMEMKDTPKMIL
jgi:hypothetical protein